MERVRQAAARERRLPVYWWLGLLVLTGSVLVAVVYRHWPDLALPTAILLAATWIAPVLAQRSLAMPRRPDKTLAPGRGSFADWKRQAQLLGRLLLYYEDEPALPPDLRGRLQVARGDLRDTLRAHPLRDDLERVVARVIQNAVIPMKIWQWAEFGPQISELVRQYEAETLALAERDARALALEVFVERAAAEMSRHCLPRMQERERLECALECSSLAILSAQAHGNVIHPIELAAMFAVNWCDFTEPWRPALLPELVIRYHQEHPDSWRPSPAAGAAVAPGEEAPPPSRPAGPDSSDIAGRIVIRNGKRYRRVRVRRKRSRSRTARQLPVVNVLLSFGQWVRYSLRAWTQFH